MVALTYNSSWSHVKKKTMFVPAFTGENFAMDRRTFLCLYFPGFPGQVFKPGKILSEQLKKLKEQKKNKGSFPVAESAYNAQKAQFGLVMASK